MVTSDVRFSHSVHKSCDCVLPDTSIMRLPQFGHDTFVMFSIKVIGMLQFVQFQVGMLISMLNLSWYLSHYSMNAISYLIQI